EYKFGKVNIFSMHPEKDACKPKETVDPNAPCGGTLTFKDERIEFRAKSIIIENGGSLIAGTRANPIGTTGLGPDKTHSHVLTIILYGEDQGFAGNGGSGAPCLTPNSDDFPFCGIPKAAWGGGQVALPGMPATFTDTFYQYKPLFADGGDPNAFFGYKVL